MSSHMSPIDWEDEDASVDAVVYSASGLRMFYRTYRARAIFGLVLCMSLAVTLLGIARPMGSVDSLRFDRELRPHEVAFVEIYACCALWALLTLLLMQQGLTNMAVSLVLPWVSCCLLNMLAGIPLSILAKDPNFIVYYCVFSVIFSHLFYVSMTHGLFLLRLFQLGPWAFATNSATCFALGDHLWAAMWAWTCLSTVPIYAYIVWRRQISMRAAVSLIRQDAALYDKIWGQVSADQGEAIDGLEAQVSAVEKHLDARRALRQDVADLADLFAQARALDGHFQAKLHEWATAGGGTCSECPIKQHRRALQKTMRSYVGDASRITDLVRGSIVYGGVGELLVGLQAVLADTSVGVQRIKNRFARSYDSTNSAGSDSASPQHGARAPVSFVWLRAYIRAGYRDVCIVLQLQSPETVAAGLDQHLCELQLHIAPIAAVKSDAGHKRYVQWRNMRGE